MFGMLVAHNDQDLLKGTLFALLKFLSLSILFEWIDSGTAAQSPFVIAMSHTGVKGAILSPFTLLFLQGINSFSSSSCC